MTGALTALRFKGGKHDGETIILPEKLENLRQPFTYNQDGSPYKEVSRSTMPEDAPLIRGIELELVVHGGGEANG